MAKLTMRMANAMTDDELIEWCVKNPPDWFREKPMNPPFTSAAVLPPRLTEKQRDLLDRLTAALDYFQARSGPKGMAILLISPREFDAVTLEENRTRRLPGWRVYGYEIAPDPRVGEGVAVACDSDLKWLGAFAWGGSWRSEQALNSLGHTWKAFKASFDELLDRNAGFT